MSDVPLPPSPEALLQIIGREFVNVAPNGWVRGEILFMRVGKTGSFSAAAFPASGERIGLKVTRPMMRAFDDLRAAMTQPGKGAFLTARYALTAANGQIDVDYDYDHEPAFDVPIHPGHYVEELEQNPRAPEIIPEWWRIKVEEAERLDRKDR